MRRISTIDNTLCMCRKNKTSGINQQCPYKKKFGDYCGRHKHSHRWRIRVDNMIYEDDIYFLQNKKLELYTLKELHDINNKFNMNINIKLYNSKDKIIEKIKTNLKSQDPYFFEKDKIIFLQNKIKKYLKTDNFLRGPAFTNRQKSNNKEDFYTFDKIDKIENKYFFSYRDKDNFIYSFDLRSIKKLIDMKMDNPYNRNQFPNYIVKRIKSLYNNVFLDPLEDTNISKKQFIKSKVIKVFQQIDEVGSYSGGTNINWFLNLDIQQTKYFYKVLEDIWNYRAQLSPEKKNRIIPDDIVFPISVREYYKINSLYKLRNIALTEMEKFVFKGISYEDKTLGGYYILIALVETSSECANAIPWLIQ